MVEKGFFCAHFAGDELFDVARLVVKKVGFTLRTFHRGVVGAKEKLPCRRFKTEKRIAHAKERARLEPAMEWIYFLFDLIDHRGVFCEWDVPFDADTRDSALEVAVPG